MWSTGARGAPLQIGGIPNIWRPSEGLQTHRPSSAAAYAAPPSPRGGSLSSTGRRAVGAHLVRPRWRDVVDGRTRCAPTDWRNSEYLASVGRVADASALIRRGLRRATFPRRGKAFFHRAPGRRGAPCAPAWAEWLSDRRAGLRPAQNSARSPPSARTGGRGKGSGGRSGRSGRSSPPRRRGCGSAPRPARPRRGRGRSTC